MDKDTILKNLNVPENDQDFFKKYIDKWKGDEFLKPSLKVLSNLDLSKVEISDSECDGGVSVSTTVSKSEIESMTKYGIDLVSNLENVLIDELSRMINSKSKVSIYKLVEDISIEENFEPHKTENPNVICRMVMKSNISCED